MAGATQSDEAFIRAHTRLSAAVLVPEVMLHLAEEPFGIWRATEQEGAVMRPFWGFAWPGGQAVARYILDNPAIVAGRSVVDIGAGSGLAAIAASRAGAAAVTAADIDPLAVAATRLNVEVNDVRVATTSRDLLADDTEAYDVTVIGDLFYEEGLAQAVTRYIEMALRRGSLLLFADRGTVRPPPGAEPLARYAASVAPELQEGFIEEAVVWRLGAAFECSYA